MLFNGCSTPVGLRWTFAVDVFAIGATAFELHTGLLLIPHGPTLMETLFHLQTVLGPFTHQFLDQLASLYPSILSQWPPDMAHVEKTSQAPESVSPPRYNTSPLWVSVHPMKYVSAKLKHSENDQKARSSRPTERLSCFSSKEPSGVGTSSSSPVF